MLCSNCGQSLQEGKQFCTNCGLPVPPQQQPPAAYYQAPPPPPGYPQGPPPPQGPGYGPGWMPPQAPPPKRDRTGLIVGSIAAGVILIAALVVGLYFGLRDRDSDDTSTDKPQTTRTSVTGGSTGTTEEVFAQKEGEIFLEPAGAAGPDAFAGETFVTAGPPSTLNIPTTDTLLPPLPPTTAPPGTATTVAGVQVASVSGDTPALYGGSKDKTIADKEGQLRFFEQNPDKAAAFCAALNADPTFKWSGGNQIQPSQLRAYFDELTPLMLIRDTRVTNHGYRNGKPTPRQSVLQKGQLVLVDQYGVPRVRCECGNPLTPPRPVQKTPVYTGPKWPDFDPTQVIVVQPTTIIINIFVVIDIYTGDPFDRPFGTDGTQDIAHMPSVWQLEVSMTYTDEAAHDYTVEWTGAVTLNEDGSLTGEGAGQWYVQGPYYNGDTPIGQMSSSGSCPVEFSGQLDATDIGDMLTIYPYMSSFSIDSQTWDPPDDTGEAVADFESVIQDIIAMSFVESLQITPTSQEPVYLDLASEGWVGSATLAPYEP